MLGLTSVEETRTGYLDHYPKERQVGDMTALATDHLHIEARANLTHWASACGRSPSVCACAEM